MALVALDGTPLVFIGGAGREGHPLLPGPTNTTMDAVNEAVIMIGRVFTEDGASHTIDTTGASSLGWRTGGVTFSNAATTVVAGLAAVDTSAGPPARAVNVADVITLDVSKSMIGGGGAITANAWQEHVPDAGTKTIANGDLVAFCVQMIARGGADSVVATTGTTVTSGVPVRPAVTNFVAAAYTGSGSLPNAVITFSDGTLGVFFGASVFSVPSTTQTWNNSSATKEYGNFFQLPVPVKVYGLALACSVGADVDLILYSSPLGTPVAEKTVSVDANAVGAASASRWFAELFPAPYSAAANQLLAGIMKPTTTTNISSVYTTLNASAHQKSFTPGVNGYAISRDTGAFAAQNSNKDRYAVGLLVGAFEHGVSPTYGLGI